MASDMLVSNITDSVSVEILLGVVKLSRQSATSPAVPTRVKLVVDSTVFLFTRIRRSSQSTTQPSVTTPILAATLKVTMDVPSLFSKLSILQL